MTIHHSYLFVPLFCWQYLFKIFCGLQFMRQHILLWYLEGKFLLICFIEFLHPFLLYQANPWFFKGRFQPWRFWFWIRCKVVLMIFYEKFEKLISEGYLLWFNPHNLGQYKWRFFLRMSDHMQIWSHWNHQRRIIRHPFLLFHKLNAEWIFNEKCRQM